MIYKYLIFSVFLVMNNICFSADKKIADEIDLKSNEKFIKVKVNVKRHASIDGQIGCECDNHYYYWFVKVVSNTKVYQLKYQIIEKIKKQEFNKAIEKGYKLMQDNDRVSKGPDLYYLIVSDQFCLLNFFGTSLEGRWADDNITNSSFEEYLCDQNNVFNGKFLECDIDLYWIKDAPITLPLPSSELS